jgi:hypothetical protein
LLCELLGVCVCAREQIRNPFARKKGRHKHKHKQLLLQQQQQQEVHLQKDERGSFALEKDDLGRERKPFCFVFFVFSLFV